MRSAVYVILLTWNSERYIDKCLESIFAVTHIETRVLCADNGSTDQSAQLLRAWQEREPERMTVVFYDENLGTTRPRNRLLRMVPQDAEWICVLDSDTIVNEAAFASLIDALRENPSAALAAPRMWSLDGKEQMSVKKFPTLTQKMQKAFPMESVQRKGEARERYAFFPSSEIWGDHPPFSKDVSIYPVDYAISACWMLRTSAVRRIGYLDEKYFYAPEDVDYCAMIWENGYEVLLVSGASIFHDTQRLSKKKRWSRINWIHLCGLFRYFCKHKYLFRARIRRTRE